MPTQDRPANAGGKGDPKVQQEVEVSVVGDYWRLEAHAHIRGGPEGDARITVTRDRSTDAFSVAVLAGRHTMALLGEQVGGTAGLRVVVSFDGWASSFLTERDPPRILQLFRPQFVRLQQAAVEARFLETLAAVRRRVAESKYAFLAQLTDPLAAILGAYQRSFADADAAFGTPFRGIIDPFTLSQRIFGLTILLQVPGPTIGPAPVVEVPVDPPPPSNPEEAARGHIPAGQQHVTATRTWNGNYKRVKSFNPAAWTQTGRVMGGGTLTYYEFVRTVNITFEEVQKVEDWVTWKCPGTCWGFNESTHCTSYAVVLRTWTGTHTETVWVWAPDYGPTGSTFPPVPPSPNQPPEIDHLAPPP